ncbi:magnesium transporter [Sedimentibacter sp. zth1]|uniref:magnesium transporter n=1 Tax=Sedimentibacter sp. zth1 TaxID=2816908 RepID=UPI001A93A433|nr:magnesium transporter [Sedimentibacter sp. zth1]QSX06533.1 magnesium transporter [Sedimentibacter sp. zth1]
MNTENTLITTIITLTEKKKFSSLKDIFITIKPIDIAILFEEINEDLVPLLFRLLPKEKAAETFIEMESDFKERLIKGFSNKELKEVVDELYIDDAVDLVEEMPANVVGRILRQADTQKRQLINSILQYPENSAGSIMTTEFVNLQPSTNVNEAIKHIRLTGIHKETINVCYVTDETKRLIGVVSILKLIVSDESEIINDIMEKNIISVCTQDEQEEVAHKFSKYDFFAMPVVDTENRMVGIITVDDAIDVLEDETTEDINIMAAITPSTKPYIKTRVFDIFKSRIPWLLLLMISATFTGIIIKRFESALSACVILTSFIPMLMDTGGNCGSQASVTIIRGISLDEIRFKDILKVAWKEFRVAFLCGVTLAVFNFIKLILFDKVTIFVALTVCITLVVTVFIAKIVGCTLPMLAKKIGFDPAVMASPFITTIVDAMSLLIYFKIAAILLGV